MQKTFSTMRYHHHPALLILSDYIQQILLVHPKAQEKMYLCVLTMLEKAKPTVVSMWQKGWCDDGDCDD